MLAACLLPLACLLLLAGMGGCATRMTGHAFSGASTDGPPAAEASMVSRVLLPPRGGQTITVPRFMADAQKLWSPLTATDSLALPALRRKALPAALPAAPAAPAVPADLSATLPAALLDATERERAGRYLARLVGGYRGTTEQSLRRAAEHMPLLLDGLRRAGLPQELAAIPLVESAFENKAVSRAGAAGLWQLMPETARRYGLVVSAGRDERFDVTKATGAATAYLRFLYGHFGNWPLALAAYNCGEGALRRALDRTGSRSLGEVLAKNRDLPQGARVLVEETVQYVPKVAAAVAVMTQGDVWGLPVAGLLPHGGPARDSALASPLAPAMPARKKEELLAGNPPMPVLQSSYPEPERRPPALRRTVWALPRIERE